MGCGCGGRKKSAVTSVNQAELELQQQESENALQQQMSSLRAAVHNSNSEVVIASSGKIS
jgi:hypothetical protein